MNGDRTFELLADINPVPDPEQLDTPLTLTISDTKRGAMATTRMTRDSELEKTAPPSVGGRGLRVALVAAALVMLAGVATWLVTTSGDDVAASPIELASTYMDARANNDPDEALRVLSPTASVDGELPSIADFSELPGVFEYLARQQFEWTYTCEEASSRSVIVDCAYTGTSLMSRALGDEVYDGQLTFYVEGDQIVRVLHSLSFRYQADVLAVFDSWMETEHPEVVAQLYDEAGRFRYEAGVFDLFSEYLAEFEASLGR